MGGSRTVNAGACTSRMAIAYRARFIDDTRIELSLDSLEYDQALELNIHDPNGTTVCTRVVRNVPFTLTFKAPIAGRYEMELSTIGHVKSRPQNFTWSDWDRDFTSGGSDVGSAGLPDGTLAYAFLDVA